jgi:fermentation-respiration switch protein FrsA (DUF1100 family)
MALAALRPTSKRLAEPLASPERFYRAPPALQLIADPSRRAPVRFDSDGISLAGHLYRPPGADARQATPGIVMCGPASSVKEQTLPHYAQRFADAGYTVLTFDPRTYGESEGSPRCYYDPARIIDDYANAVSYLLTRGDIIPSAVGLVGICMGGGYAVSTAARDKRVAAAVTVGGGFNIGGTFLALLGSDGFAGFMRQLNALATEEYASGETRYIPTIAPDLSNGPAFMPNPEAFSYYDRTSRTDAPTWENRVAAKSLQSYFAYNAIPHASLIAPVPLLVVHGTVDLFLWPEFAQQVYDAATGDKEIAWIETHNHIELYDQDPYVSEVTTKVIDWLGSRLART